MRYFFSYCHLFAAIIYGILGIIILSKDHRSRLNQTCAAEFACFFLWSFSFVWIHHPDASESTAKLIEKISSPGWIWFGFFHLWFAWLYTRRRPFRFFTVVAALFIITPSVLVFQQVFNNALITNHVYREFGWVSLWGKSFWANAYFSYYLITVFIGLYLLNDYRKKTDNAMIKQQALILIISGLITVFVGSLLNVLLPMTTDRPVAPMADSAALIWAIGLAYVAIKYHMLDITPFIAAQRIITVMKDLLFLLDTHGRIISVNPSAREALACNDAQMIGRPFSDLIATDKTERDSLMERATGSPAYSAETVLALHGGPSIQVALSTSLIPATGIVCVAHDISLQKQRTELLNEAKKRLESEVSRATDELQKTNARLTGEIAEREQAALALMETEERFRVIFENAPDGIFLMDPEGRFVDVNNEASRITGYDKNELAGKNVFASGILHPADRDNDADILARHLLGKTSGGKEVTIIKKDNSTIPAELNSHQVKIGDRHLVLGVVRDLTQRKKAEAEAEELKRQLDQAKKIEAIGRLAGGIAHDFNNLLGGIIGYAGLLRKKLMHPLPAEAGIVQKIIDIGRQASDHAAQLLAFARKGKYQVAPVNIHHITDDVVGLLEHTIDRKISLVRLYRASFPTVMGDRSQLHSALLNLGVNARDALTSGGVITFATEVIHIDKGHADDCRCAVEAGDYLKITVSDNGIGMDEQTRSHIFEPFFSTKEPGKGTGLGLASVYGTIKNHNGSIELRSGPGKGTTFTICLPLAANTPVPPEEKGEPAADMGRQSGMILVVDDLPVVREMTMDVLTELGYTVNTCNDGGEALQWFRRHHAVCDLVILDLTMPKLSGKECFMAMKGIAPSVKAIITSGHAMDNEIGDLLNEGVCAFLQKPFEIERLSEAVQEALENDNTARHGWGNQ